jgi:5'-3' exonuclease
MKDCIDWTWCFPHHHGLFISDLSNYMETTSSIEFNKLFVKPSNNNYNKVKPFEQLMMVLPKQLSYMLPAPLKKIMQTDEIIRKLSPMIFDQDMLYKTKLWQCIPNVEMIPLEHIQDLVLKATLTEADMHRNKTSKVYQNQM